MTLGGSGDFNLLKGIARRMLGNPAQISAQFSQKSDPMDYLVYQSEMSQKYPAYIPTNTSYSAGCPTIPIATLATVLQAKTPTAAGGTGSANGSISKTLSGNGKNGKGLNGGMGNGISGTQPFIFPSSSMNSSTPRSILEAEELFKKNMYISTATLQVYHEKKLMTDRRYRSKNDAEDQDSGRALEYRQPASIRNKIRPRRRSLARRFSGNGNQGDDEADDASEDDFESDDGRRRSSIEVAAVGKEAIKVTDRERERIERIEHIYVSCFRRSMRRPCSNHNAEQYLTAKWL